MSAKGTGAFVAIRATSVVLLPFVAWFLWSLVAHAGDDYAALRAWLSGPVVAVVFAAFIIVMALHMRLGMNEVIEDYIHDGWRRVLRAANTAAAAAISAAAVYGAYLHAFQG